MANKERAFSESGGERRRFVRVQGAKAIVGLILGAGFLVLLGRPNTREAIALAALLAPAALALLGLLRLPLALLETASQIVFAATVGYLAFITGGIESPLTIWFALVPAEAALGGGRGSVMRAAAAAVTAMLVVGGAEAIYALPASPLLAPPWEFYLCSAFAAVLQAAFLAGAAQDRQRRADEAVAKGATLYRFLADNAIDLITLHGSDGRIRFASPAALALLGRDPASLVGRAASELAHTDDLKTMQAAFMEASYFGRSAEAEVRMKRADGSYVWTEIRCRPAEAVNGEGAEIVAITRDVSERKLHEKALIEARDLAEGASRAKSHFLANMSHELRTPLNAIIGFSEVMTHEMFGPLGGVRYREYAGLIHESGGHLLDLINGILDMSKIEAGKFELSEELFDLADVTEQSVRFVKLQADRKGVVLKTDIPAECATIFADKRAIKQMLVNLLTNGVKFTPRGGEVKVWALRDSGGLQVVVRDTGIGISPEDVKRLGRPFEQADSGHTKSQEGTGLGLALVKAFAALHGGDAVLESKLGAGTTVRVRLPYAAVNTDAVAAETVAAAADADADAESNIIPFKGAA